MTVGAGQACGRATHTRPWCYFGCDHPDIDDLHREELEAAERAGAVSLRPTFSATPKDGARFVQHRIAAEGGEIWTHLKAGGRVFVCGGGCRMAPAVREAFMTIYSAHTGAGAGDDEARAWPASLTMSGHYIEDVWAG
ncbi:hypothetical protein [Streptomyces sp. NPDC048825]|uniref:hypothetical protein n=1 Tax=Streptomyces sp. NPDC048825 TaxID=3365592 RepID=UPI003714A7A4